MGGGILTVFYALCFGLLALSNYSLNCMSPCVTKYIFYVTKIFLKGKLETGIVSVITKILCVPVQHLLLLTFIPAFPLVSSLIFTFRLHLHIIKCLFIGGTIQGLGITCFVSLRCTLFSVCIQSRWGEPAFVSPPAVFASANHPVELLLAML